MTQNNTILSEKESFLLENLITKYGLFVDFDQIYAELGQDYTRQKAKKMVIKLTKNGWFVRIKKGVYYITNLESRGFAGASVLVIAQAILDESYVSFEAALQHHGVFDQHTRTVTSVCIKKKADKTIQGITYRFIKVSRKNFYGWEETQIEGRAVKMATLEKAILDMIRSQRSIHSLDLVLEKLREDKDNFDFEKLNELAKGQSITVQRMLGFLLDKAGIDSSSIYEVLKSKDGASFMTKDSEVFSGKWNLYHHNHFA
jgi:predicted transcriptional regulator of viral defense system